MSRRTMLIQMLIPYLAVGLGFLAAAIGGGADPLPSQTAQAQALALVSVGHRLCQPICRRGGEDQTLRTSRRCQDALTWLRPVQEQRRR